MKLIIDIPEEIIDYYCWEDINKCGTISGLSSRIG